MTGTRFLGGGRIVIRMLQALLNIMWKSLNNLAGFIWIFVELLEI